MGEDRREALTIRQAATLLSVHPNTVRNRIKLGKYKADKVVTEHGETYLIPRSELAQDSTTNKVSTPTPTQSPSQPLPDVREAMQTLLEPFVRELGDVREELGRERQRRRHAEEEAATLRAQLRILSESTEAAETVEEAPERAEPRPAMGEAQEAVQRPWWRRVFGR